MVCIGSTAVLSPVRQEGVYVPSELLCADDLILMAPIMEPLGRRLAEYNVSLLDKGQKVNAGKSNGW